MTLVRGAPKLGEMLFLHRASRTLVATDFVFLYPEPRGWLFRLYLGLTRSVGVPAQTLILRSMAATGSRILEIIRDTVSRLSAR